MSAQKRLKLKKSLSQVSVKSGQDHSTDHHNNLLLHSNRYIDVLLLISRPAENIKAQGGNDNM